MRYLALLMLLLATSCISVGVESKPSSTNSDKELCQVYSDYLAVLQEECRSAGKVCYKTQDQINTEMVRFTRLCSKEAPHE